MDPVPTASPPNPAPSSNGDSGAVLVERIMVVILSALGLAWVQFATPHMVGVDSYFHVKIADLMWERGAPIRDFPWNVTSIFKDHFSDSSLLFHALLSPLGAFEDPVVAAKGLTVVFGVILFTLFHATLRSRNCPFPLLFVLLLGATGPLFMFRLMMTRGYLLSMILALAAYRAMLENRTRWLFVIAVLFPLSYTAFQLILILAVIHAFAIWLAEGRIEKVTVTAAFGGVALGLVLHPDFPDDLTLWYIQNVRVLGLKWFGSMPLFFGSELSAPQLTEITQGAPIPFLAMLFALVVGILRPGRRGSDTVSAMLVSLSFLALMLMSKRFVEYAAPFSVLFAALMARDALSTPAADPGLEGRLETIGGLAFLGVLLLSGVLLNRSFNETRLRVQANPKPESEAAGRWLAANTKPDSLVFTADWDDFPQLFYFSPANRYLVGLDPAFFYEHDRALWQRWSDLTNGRVADPYQVIKDEFKSDYAFVTYDFKELRNRVRKDPRMRKMFSSPHCTIYELAPPIDYVRDFRLTAPIDLTEMDAVDRDRWVLDDLADKPPAEGVEPPRWTRRTGPEKVAFIDLGDMAAEGKPSSIYAMAKVRSRVQQPVTFHMGGEDSLVLWVNGEKRFESGSLSPEGVDAVTARVTLQYGPNIILLRCDHHEGPWGFSLRLEGKQPFEVVSPMAKTRTKGYVKSP